jgi:hypothetical protein
VVLNTLLGAMGIVLLIYAKFRLWQSNKNLHIVIYSIKMAFLQVINLVLIATGLFRFKGNTAFFDFHFMSTFFPITLLFISWFYLNIAFKHIKFENKINMKLTTEQIEYVENYIISKDIKWYELQVELTDHMVTSILGFESELFSSGQTRC